jgi:hypothetical protein
MGSMRRANVLPDQGRWSVPRSAATSAAALLLAFCLPVVKADPAGSLPRPPADMQRVLELFTGAWEVRTRTSVPKPADVRSTESWSWVLDQRFVRGDTGVKSDGSQEIVFMTYDPASRGFPFWIYSSSGLWIYLEPGKWNESTRTLEWKSGLVSKVIYASRCSFPDARSRHCVTTAKDLFGRVVLAQESVALRRAP